jgi:hypothetical protein
MKAYPAPYKQYGRCRMAVCWTGGGVVEMNAPGASSSPDLIRQSMKRLRLLRVSMHPRVKPAGDDGRKTHAARIQRC